MRPTLAEGERLPGPDSGDDWADRNFFAGCLASFVGEDDCLPKDLMALAKTTARFKGDVFAMAADGDKWDLSADLAGEGEALEGVAVGVGAGLTLPLVSVVGCAAHGELSEARE